MMRKHIKTIGVFGLVILMLGTVIVPSAVSVNKFRSTHTIYGGNILYVGGSGPGNYTEIQEAINDSFEGDTVFVYSGIYNASYRETIYLHKTGIQLQGEDKETTVINANLSISGKNNTLNGFTINHVRSTGENMVIINNILKSNTLYQGRGLDNSGINSVFTDNFICDYWIGFDCGGENNIFEGNTVMNCGESGIFCLGLWDKSNNTIVNNTIIDNGIGIFTVREEDLEIENNIITNNNVGIYLSLSQLVTVKNNNLYDNKEINAAFNIGFTRDFRHRPLIKKNVWSGNYWGKELSVKFVLGTIDMLGHFLGAFVPIYPELTPDGNFLPMIFQIDKEPAQEPFEY